MAEDKAPPPWRRVFLRALARSGSVALAAQRSGIDRTSAYQVRKANPAFAASWDRALAAARERLEAAAGPRLRGDEVVRASKSGKPCIVRAGPGRWCADSEAAFLDALAASANVKAAARAAGISAVAVYNRRRQWPAFRAAWDAAKAEGYVRIEMLLLHAATATLDPEAAEEARTDGSEPPEMSVDQAMKLLFHRDGAHGARGGRGRGYGWRRQEPDIEEVRAELLRKVAAMERARGRGILPEAAVRAGRSLDGGDGKG